MAATRYELLFSDIKMGHPELGWMPRGNFKDLDDEDLKYQRFLKSRGISARVQGGYAWVDPKN